MSRAVYVVLSAASVWGQVAVFSDGSGYVFFRGGGVAAYSIDGRLMYAGGGPAYLGLEKMGAATLSQIVKATGRGWGAVQWHLYVLEREGRVKSVRIGPFIYYFVNPRAAAEVILASASPDGLSPEDREKLDLLASGA